MKKIMLLFFACLSTTPAVAGLRDMAFIRRYNAAQGNIVQAPLYFDQKKRRRGDFDGSSRRRSRFGHKRVHCARNDSVQSATESIKTVSIAQNQQAPIAQSTHVLNCKI